MMFWYKNEMNSVFTKNDNIFQYVNITVIISLDSFLVVYLITNGENKGYNSMITSDNVFTS